jgi:TonB-dependent starch-binding outer membrane protein SusC
MKKWLRKLNLIQLIVIMSVGLVNAQEIVLSGIISSKDGIPIPGVSVVIKGTSTGALSDANGHFSLKSPSGSQTIVFSFVGMKTQELPISKTTTYNVIMEEDTYNLEEVVAIGYGTVKKSDLTGSVTSVKNEAITSFASTNVMQSLNGRAAGVQVNQNSGQPGTNISVRIRGTNSIQGSNEPLYVIDGFPVSSINSINNSEIASIEILKDASATAIYGSRGANGVVLITTKRGEAGATRVDYESSFGVQTLRKKLDLMNATEYANFYNEQQLNDVGSKYFTDAEVQSFGKGFDWQDYCFRSAPIIRNSLTVSGGNSKTQFAISGSVYNQEGIIDNSNYNRYSLISNIKHDISKIFAIECNVKLTKNKTNRQDSSGGNRGGSLLASIISAPPTLTPYNDDGSYRDLMTAYSFMSNAIYNPLNFINETENTSVANVVQANAAALIKPIDGLTIKIFGGIENNDSRSDYYQSLKFLNSQGYASVSTSQYTGLLNENTISYVKTFNKKHSLSALAGFTYEDGVSKGLSGSGTGFLSDLTETANLSAASTSGIPGTSYSKWVLMSYLGRINYTYDNKYLFTASIRADGSSKYSEGNKWGYFPSGAFAWRVKNESFMKNLPFISDLKLRTSWGLTGSQAIDPYATLSQLSSGKTVFGKTQYTTFAPSTSLPGNLKWETTEQMDVGMDIAFLDGRFKLTADAYVKNTRDLLNTVQLPTSTGYSQTIKNVGEIRNKGLEISADAIVFNGKFKWDLSGNIAFNRSKVTKLYNDQDILSSGVSVVYITNIQNILRVGQPLCMFYGYVDNGYDSNGKPQYVDLDGNGSITTSDRTIIGNPNPDFIYGLNSTMSYKNFELTMFWQGTYGNDIADVSAIGNTLDYGYGLNMLKEVYYDHWTTDNPNAKYPKITNSLNMNFSRRIIEDGSYLRLRDIQLGYRLPVSKTNITWLKNALVYVSGQNLLTFTKYSWWDPEVNSQGGSNSLNQGMDYYTYPTAKTVTLGIKVGF